MPTYEYACAKCGKHVEVYQTFSEEPLKRHNQFEGSKCTGTVQKVFSPVGIVLKGSGFYKTDSRNASRAASKSSESKSSSSESKSSDSGSSDSKSDSKSSSSDSSSKQDAKKSDSGSKKATSTPAKKSA
jgi:putative FmdB family regulatory protein